MRPATVLIVEDDRSMLDGIKDLMQVVDLGYEIKVLTAGNGRLALERLANHTPDLIVSDIMMPEMEGYEFLERVRQNPAWVHIPVIFLTAKGSKRDIHRGRASGADLYITKPFNSVEFLELVKGQLDRAFQLLETRNQIMNNLKKDILQILNHEFRTPLTYVTAYYEMLADSVNQPQERESYYEYLRGIQVGCIRLTRLVEDFIKVVEIRTGEMNVRFRTQAQPLNELHAIIREAIAANHDLSSESGVRVIYNPSPALPGLFGDRQGLLEAFTRLLNNAIKFTHGQQSQQGSVHISTTVVDDRVAIEIRDEGIGFPAHVRDKLFTLFYQYNRGLFEQQGSGIGLTIAKAWVDLHGGTIEVDSVENEGSTFTVFLPTMPTPQEHLSPLLIDRDQQLATVLVVEDDPHLLIGLQELLEIFEGKYRLHVLTAGNGRLGLEVLGKHQPNLIISDIMMPEMGGYDFLKAVRLNPNWVQIPFIFLTAKGEPRDRHHAQTSGVEEYITKPYDSDELLELITTQLDRHFRVQEAIAQNFEDLKRSILTLITPDFRLPLTAVTSYSEQLANGLQDARTDEELKDSLEGIKSGSVRLNQLVEDLISLAELKTGEAATAYSLRAQPVRNVGVVLFDAAQPYMLQAESRGLTFHFELAQELPRAHSDTSMLLAALQRLVEKGLTYCPQGATGEIILRAASEVEAVHLSLELPAFVPDDEKAALLSVGEHVGEGGLPQYPNLSIVRGIVGLHNGRILMDETDMGTTITIALPAYVEKAAIA